MQKFDQLDEPHRPDSQDSTELQAIEIHSAEPDSSASMTSMESIQDSMMNDAQSLYSFSASFMEVGHASPFGLSTEDLEAISPRASLGASSAILWDGRNSDRLGSWTDMSSELCRTVSRQLLFRIQSG